MENKLSVIIIDDEKLARDLIKNYLSDYSNLVIADECENGFEGIKSINQHKPDLIFLDIQMPKLNGFEMLELIDHNLNIIFSTAYDQYALKAFEVNAVDYLLKPFSRDRFAEAINRVLEKIGNTESENLLPKELANKLIPSDEKLKRIVVKENHKITIIPTDQIVYLEAQDDYVKIVTKESSSLKQNTMKFFEEHLPDTFIRIHRSFIVNITSVKQIDLLSKDSHAVLLKDGKQIPVSKAGYKKLRKIIR
ncbi:MAG: LytTR family transcriptional regulator DNA-binding domain-containing protein [Bacteroidota bacterium]